ncbi:MAG: type II/IV secretion system protein [Candidatus Nomurabacteria bacterium]|nr:MAG: type II/IV secretion system protein [Candidatus Nomurabacteria bacterium]
MVATSSSSNTSSSHSIPIAPKEVEQRFDRKMEQMKQRELERQVRDEAIRRGLGYTTLVGVPIDQDSLKAIPRETALQRKMICFNRSREEMRVAVLDPNQEGLDELLQKLSEEQNLAIGLYLVSPKSIQAALTQYDTLPQIKPQVSGVQVTEKDLNRFRKEPTLLKDLEDQLNRIPVTDVLSLLLASATQSRATDIHIEAEENDVKIRFRIDGILHTVATLPKESWKKLISRIKILAGLKLNIEDKPQDGRITLRLSDDEVDIRVSTVPTAYGESVALRLLLASEAGLTLDDLGLRGQAFEQLKREISRPNGMIITTGPTGSGKTTTLYAFLKQLNRPETKILTLEDPIEYKLEGINQSQVNPEEGYNFVRGLKHALRQDPDIVMVGEIRDLETAEIAIQATLTGHLVISTLHTNNAAGAVPRFLSLGVKPFLLAPALNAVIGQRLVRRLCQECKKPAELDGETSQRIKEYLEKIPEDSKFRPDMSKPLTFYIGGGCEVCGGIGYQGRVGIYEVMTMNQELEKLVLAGNTSEYDIEANAVKHGMITMVQDGLLKALDGITSVDEVFRVAE